MRLYEIAGPLFFGAAAKAMSVLDAPNQKAGDGAIIVYMGQVPVIDATGLVALETTLGKLRRRGHRSRTTGDPSGNSRCREGR